MQSQACTQGCIMLPRLVAHQRAARVALVKAVCWHNRGTVAHGHCIAREVGALAAGFALGVEAERRGRARLAHLGLLAANRLCGCVLARLALAQHQVAFNGETILRRKAQLERVSRLALDGEAGKDSAAIERLRRVAQHHVLGATAVSIEQLCLQQQQWQQPQGSMWMMRPCTQAPSSSCCCASPPTSMGMLAS